MTAERTAVILAAGVGKRMRSQLIKVLHQVGGRPLIGHVVAAVRRAGIERIIVVVGPQGDEVRRALGDGIDYVVQSAPLGTGHAALQARPLLTSGGTVIILNGDVPLLNGEELAALADGHAQGACAASVLTARMEDPAGYGRIVRDSTGQLLGIVEDRDATMAQRGITEVNAGVYCFESQLLFPELARLERQNRQGEYYLTDVVASLRSRGLAVAGIPARDPQVAQGVNDRKQLAEIARILQQREVTRLMESGVTVISPDTTFVDSDVEVGQDTVIWPMTFLGAGTRIGAGCEIGPNTTLKATQVGSHCRISYSVVESGALGFGVTVGPFAHLRPGCVLEEEVRVGNFAELKNTRVGAASKVSHHSYLGDTDIGPGVNIGAGAVTVNYDGQAKHRTSIEEGAFIGCNANLLAPLRVGAGAYVAAGSTVGEDVPAQALAIARKRQVNKEDWVKENRKKPG